MNDILFGILEAVIVAAVAAVARYLIPYIRERLRQSRYSWLVDVIDAAVRAFEQIIGSGNGEQKKAAVISYVNEWLVSHHVDITTDQLDKLIESAVNVMNTEFGKNDTISILTDFEEDDGK